MICSTSLRSLRGTLQRRRLRQLKAAEHVSLVFVGEKAAGDFVAEEAGSGGKQKEQKEGEAGLVDEVAGRRLRSRQ